MQMTPERGTKGVMPFLARSVASHSNTLGTLSVRSSLSLILSAPLGVMTYMCFPFITSVISSHSEALKTTIHSPQC